MPAPFGGHEPPPVIGVVCCVRTEGEHTFHTVSEKYIVTVVDAVGGLPLLVPAAGDRVAAEDMVQRLDGLLLTGSRTDIEPHNYGGAALLPDRKIDPQRDRTSLPLIRAAARADVPVLAICRGMQELNVALGGSLHTVLHEVPGRLDHRAPKRDTMDERYAHLAHPVTLAPGGLFAKLAGGETALTVNSLHFQGIDRLAAGLVVEATAPDGQIEGVHLPQARFIVGVQWHPEHRHQETPFSRALFAAFGEACHASARRRRAA